MTDSRVRLGVETWESLFRAQATVRRQISEEPFRSAFLQLNEYAVLHALSSTSQGLRMTDLGKDVLLTQAGMSRLVLRLERRGLIKRTDDPDDGRACRLRLSPEGRELHRRVGSVHARQVAEVMHRAMSSEQLEALRSLCRALVEDASAGQSAPAEADGEAS